ncbi:hypothetical protein BKA62DRAFT_713675 [Auriculariales sp. MPI-PUGE-AT-0066]|nr:hypothetical protein BKA62DRAFT_713675 [Auriculariales sp. MPI-PUGE-AT-0066]
MLGVAARSSLCATPLRVCASASFSTSAVRAKKIQRKKIREGGHHVPRKPRGPDNPAIPPPPPKPKNVTREAHVRQPGEYALPREKMRLLCELYHQAGEYITAENVTERIDEAFTGDMSTEKILSEDYRDLVDKLHAREAAPEYIRPENSLAPLPISRQSPREWSNGLSKGPDRRELVRAALWGTTLQGLPSLEIVEEQRSQMDKMREIQADMVKQSQNDDLNDTENQLA